MNIKYVILFSILQFPLFSFGQCNRLSDSLVLVALYNATDGPNWFNEWNLDQPMSTWYGITLNSEGCVHCIDLDGRLDCAGYSFNNIGNNLVGHIPDSLGYLSQLEYISFGNNSLTGSIPSSLGQLENLIELILRYNNLTGSIPPELGHLQDLGLLNLSYNNLSGEIPDEIGNIDRLGYLFLFDNNLTGSIPTTFSVFNNMIAFGAADNQLTGEIPAFLGELNILHRLDLQNNEFIGCFPEELRSLCEDDVNFSGNIALPWQGDFDQFCNSSNQVGAPCDDGDPFTVNSINTNCDCITIFTSLTGMEDTPFSVFPNPVVDLLTISNDIEMSYTICSIDGQQISSFQSNHYDVSNLSQGVYLLGAHNKATGLRRIIKFIKL